MIEVLPISQERLTELFCQLNLEYNNDCCFGYRAFEANKDTGMMLMCSDMDSYTCKIVHLYMDDPADLWLADGFTRACATQAVDKRFIKIMYDKSIDDEYAASLKQLGYKTDGNALVINIADLVHTCKNCANA